MQKKIPIIVVGGDDRNIPEKLLDRLDITHVQVDAKDIGNATAVDAVAIIALRWISSQLWDKARELASKRKIPIARARTGNYILDSMMKYKSLKKLLDEQEISGNGNGTTKTEPETKTEELKSEPEVETSGLDLDELKKRYLDKLKEQVKGALKPGERIDGDQLCELLSGDDLVGLPAADIAKLLPILDLHSILCNEVGNTWVLIWSADGSYVHEPSTEEAPKPEPKPEPKPKVNRVDAMVEMVMGLPPGPYESLYQISQVLGEYKEFVTQEGNPISSTYAQKVVKEAHEVEIITMKDGRYFIEHDEKVKLERREQPKPKQPPTKRYELGKAPPEPEAQDQSGKKEVYTDSEMRNVLTPAPKVNLMPGVIDVVRTLFPPKVWQDAAYRAIHKRLDRKGYKREPIDPDLLSQEEWDGYAWESLKGLSLERIAPSLTDAMRDESCICFDCKRNFVFTKGQKQFLMEKFGEYKTPRRCPQCNEARKRGDEYKA